MQDTAGRTWGVHPTRDKPGNPKVDTPSQMLIGIVARQLKEYVGSQGLEGGTKEARDRVKRRLQELAVDALDLSGETKTQLKELLAARMPIVDNRQRAMVLGSVDYKETLAIFRGLKEQLEQHGCGILGAQLESGLVYVSVELTREISETEGAKRIEAETQGAVKLTMQAQEGGPRRMLLETALKVNGALIQKYAGGEFGTFNSITTAVMKDYVNAAFPESLGQF